MGSAITLTDPIRARKPPAPPVARASSRLVQRTCACGGTPGPDGECAACKAKRLAGPSQASTAGPGFASPGLQNPSRPPGQASTTGPSVSAGPIASHDFGQIGVFGQVQEPDDWQSGLTITGQTEEGTTPDNALAETVDGGGGGGGGGGGQAMPQQTGPTTTASCPYSATLLGFVVGPRPSCVVPTGKYGAAKLAQYRLTGPTSSGNITVDEQFTKIDDPYGVYGALKPVSDQAVNGRFDDCYALYTDNPLPADFVLKVEQNHLINGQIIDKNEVTYRNDYVFVCQHQRLSGSCDFSKRCK
jgi:hypothetical protein